MAHKLSDDDPAPKAGMTVRLDLDDVGCGEAIVGITEDCAIAVMGPRGAILTIDVDGRVSGDPAAVEQEALAIGAGNYRGRALLGLARLALRVSRFN
jgi:hypothetical protein